MSVEGTIRTALAGLVDDRVYPDIGPEGVETPYITYQQVGGEPVNFLESSVPSLKNGRFQINVWGDSRLVVANLARQVEDALRTTAALQATVLGGATALYDEETGLRGSMQDFSFWF
jgi:chaperonin GroEL (HSP60 family)